MTPTDDSPFPFQVVHMGCGCQFNRPPGATEADIANLVRDYLHPHSVLALNDDLVEEVGRFAGMTWPDGSPYMATPHHEKCRCFVCEP